MLERKLAREITVSIWEKDGKKCRVISTKGNCVLCGGVSMIPVFTFTGYNPFPCFSMKASWKAVSAWLTENGWERKPGGSRTLVFDETSSETGELVNTETVIEKYIPVPGAERK